MLYVEWNTSLYTVNISPTLYYFKRKTKEIEIWEQTLIYKQTELSSFISLLIAR